MKRCPSCQRTYDDKSQSFCLTDGTRLVDAGGQAYDKTLVAQPPPAPQPEASPHYRPQPQAASHYSPQANQSPSWPQQGAPATPNPGWEAVQPQSPYQGSAPSDARVAAAAQGRRRGLGIAALLLGILSIQNTLFIYFFWIQYYSPVRKITSGMAIVGLILGIIAATLSVANPARHAGRGLAVTGIITALVSLLLMFIRGGLF